jgi:hypothetical protein
MTARKTKAVRTRRAFSAELCSKPSSAQRSGARHARRGNLTGSAFALGQAFWAEGRRP